jgi:histone H3/H4
VSQSPIKTTSLKNYLKEQTGMRVGDDTAKHLVNLLTQAVEHITKHAQQQATQEERSTILERDLQGGFESFITHSGPTLASPAALLAAINQLDNQELTSLLQLLTQELHHE